MGVAIVMLYHNNLRITRALILCIILFGAHIVFLHTNVRAVDVDIENVREFIKRQREADNQQIVTLEKKVAEMQRANSLPVNVRVSLYDIYATKKEIARLRGYKGLPRLIAPYESGVGLLTDRIFRVVEVVNKTEMMANCEYYRCAPPLEGQGKMAVDSRKMQLPTLLEQPIHLKGFLTEGRSVGEIFEITNVVKIGKVESDAARSGVYRLIEPFDITPLLPND
jgi:hypothetical protein